MVLRLDGHGNRCCGMKCGLQLRLLGSLLMLTLVLVSNALTPLPAEDTPGISLTEAEQAWIAQNPVIRVGAETDWPPFDFVVNQQAVGYSNDLMRLMTQKVGLEIDFTLGPTFNALMEGFKARELDVMPALWYSTERDVFTTYLPPYYDIRQVVFIREKHLNLQHWSDLKALRAVGCIGYNNTKQIEDILKVDELLEVAGPGEALLALFNGDADFFLRFVGCWQSLYC